MKNLHVKHFILVSLFLALTVQVFNTSSLYISFSNLENPYKIIAGYFIGVSAEFSIFICIYAGSRAAGGWFAIITFFCGILFHNHWQEVQINIERSIYYFPTAFLSSTILQFMNSVLVWFLSELYIEKRNAAVIYKSIAELEQNQCELKCEWESLATQIDKSKKALTEAENKYSLMNNDLSQWEQKKEKLQQDITTLQKQKAGASRGVNLLAE
jgi:hypothetical protein